MKIVGLTTRRAIREGIKLGRKNYLAETFALSQGKAKRKPGSTEIRFTIIKEAQLGERRSITLDGYGQITNLGPAWVQHGAGQTISQAARFISLQLDCIINIRLLPPSIHIRSRLLLLPVCCLTHPYISCCKTSPYRTKTTSPTSVFVSILLKPGGGGGPWCDLSGL